MIKSKKGWILVCRWLSEALGSNKKWILTHILEGLEGTLFAVELRSVIDFAVAGQRQLFLRHTGILMALVISAVLLHVLGWYWEQKNSALVEKCLRVHVFKSPEKIV